jgi:hypothetical protein
MSIALPVPGPSDPAPPPAPPPPAAPAPATPTKPGTPTRGHRPCGCGDHGCGDLPELARLRYFHGQPLSALDLQREQSYHRDRARLHNRLLHGWGVVCGLDVTVPEPRPTAECDEKETGPEVVVMPGAALDCRGDEILVRHPRPVRLDALLSEETRKLLTERPATVYLAVCFHETPIDPTRPLLASGCEPAPDCQHARVLDSYRLVVTLEPPDRGPRCEPCCGACGDTCVELAAIRDFAPDRPLTAEQVDTSRRRFLARFELTEIVGVNWVHGATYTRDEANALMKTGVELWFSQGVEVATLQPGVIELTVLEGGGGRSASIYQVQGKYDGLPADPYTTQVRYQPTTKETLQYGDRLQIVVRGDFILDECCRALDADHLGGAVPFRGDAELRPAAAGDPPHCPPRPSGDGVEGGEFVSWIHVEEGGGQP